MKSPINIEPSIFLKLEKLVICNNELINKKRESVDLSLG